MTTTSSTPATNTATYNAQLIFRVGDKGALVSSYSTNPDTTIRTEKKIVIANKDMNLKAGISYDCVLRDMYKKNGYLVVSAVPTITKKVALVFKEGRDRKPVSSYQEKIVIVPDGMEIQTGAGYDCEIVLSPFGKAYIVQQFQQAPPSPAEIIPHPYPVSMVEVKIGGTLQPDLIFEATDGDEKVLRNKSSKLKQRNILNAEEVIILYEKTCREILGKHQNKAFEKNLNRLK